MKFIGLFAVFFYCQLAYPASTVIADYMVEWSEHKENKVAIKFSRLGGKVLFDTAENESFVELYKKNSVVEDSSGFFKVHHFPPKIVCKDSSIDKVTTEKKRIHFHLTLFGNNCFANLRVSFNVNNDETVDVSMDPSDIENVGLNATQINIRSRKDEKFFGFGEQYNHQNLNGLNVPMLVREQGHTRGKQPPAAVLSMISPLVVGDWSTTYAPIPFMMSSSKTSVFLKNTEYAEFDLRDEKVSSIRVWSKRMKLKLAKAESYLELVSKFTADNGRPKPIADWYHKGAIVGIMGGTDYVYSVHKALKKRGAAIASYWLQDWVGTRDTTLGTRLQWNWDLDEKRYPNFKQLMRDLKNDGIEIMGYINPFLSKISKLSKSRNDYYEEFKKSNFFIKDKNGEPYETDSGGFSGTLIDFTNEMARKRTKDIIKDMIRLGFKGWMADFGEALPFDAVLSSGESAASYHNNYPTEWAKVNSEAISEMGESENIFTFHRSAYLGSQKYANTYWTGDQMVTWDEHDGFKTAILAMTTSGMSGMALNHSDIGGYVSISLPVAGTNLPFYTRSNELLNRWLEMNAFSPFLRTHDGIVPDVNSQFYSDPKNLELFAYFSQVYAALFDYRKEVFEEAYSKGYPATRPLYAHFEDDPKVYDIKYQYLLGRDLLVAPVVEKKKLIWEVYLPEGVTWSHLWTNKSYQGGQSVKVRAEIGRPPVFFDSRNPTLQKAQKAILDIPRNWQDMPQNVIPCFDDSLKSNLEGYAEKAGETCFKIPERTN